MGAAVLRHQRKAGAGLERLAWAAIGDRLSPELDRAPRAWTTPKRDWKSSRWPCPCRPATPSTSPSCRSRSTPCEPGAAKCRLCVQRNRRGRGRLALRIETVEPPAEHLGDDLIVAHLTDRMCCDGRAVAEHSDAVRNLPHLCQAVRDEDDEHSGSGELRRKPSSHSVSRGGSAEVASSRISTEGARASAFVISTICRSASVSRRDLQVGVRRRHAEALEELDRLLPQPRLANRAKRRQWLVPKPDVLRDGQVGNE